ncbi:MAG TPA: thiolase domain-containing protein [Candidatus Thermoplasmatota archaeon]|nr:thiolase domain-containing protein [Candidatus Thermoplasmatota archaeon]
MPPWPEPKRRVAVIGAGLTKFVRRAQETPRELTYYAAKEALNSAGMTMRDIECVTLGSAPDAFDGLHMKAEYLVDGAAGFGKPYMRNYVGGGTGVFAPIHGYFHVASGLFDTCMVVAEEKMSPCKPTSQAGFNSIFDNLTERNLGPNLIWIFALEMRRYMETHGIPHEWIAEVSVKNKSNALDHPAAQIAKKITVEDVLKSEMLADPVHLLDISPVSDGAGAVILASEEVARRYTDQPVFIDGVGWNLDTAYWTNRDLYYPRYVRAAAEMAYKMAGIHDPPKEIDLAEPYDPFDYKELHHMEGLKLCKKGQAAKLTHEGQTQRDGDMPTCPSGGLLGVGNPIAAAGMMKIAELFWQLRGEAGKRQVPGDPRTGVAQAWGDLMQVGTVVVMRS